jgi:hypothetical protein
MERSRRYLFPFVCSICREGLVQDVGMGIGHYVGGVGSDVSS